jgi:hypothetical protein
MKVHAVTFESPCDLRVLPKRQWRVLADFQCRIFYEDCNEELAIVPAGFETDLASVPRLPLMYMLFGGKAREAAALHDWLYTVRRDREFADSCFYAAMRNEEDAITRAAMWLGVRVGGWAYYLSPKKATS